MVVNLPTELLRSFVAIVDSGTMLRATERVFLTQSALSLQMKRLEETLQAPLFHREGRRLVLTPVGENFLVHAREILASNDRAVAALTGDALVGAARVGLVQDFAETLLSGVLSRFNILNPDSQLQVRVGGSHELIELLKADRLDVVLCMGAADDPRAVSVSPTVWFGDEAHLEAEVLPLAILEEPCRFREAALNALEAAGRPYRVVLETPSLSVLRAAVESGLALSCRTPSFAPGLLLPADARLPALPPVAFVSHTRASPHPAIGKLADLLRMAVLTLGPHSQAPAAADVELVA
jgi:DNA-binding transcriptional LysR family regulator